MLGPSLGDTIHVLCISLTRLTFCLSPFIPSFLCSTSNRIIIPVVCMSFGRSSVSKCITISLSDVLGTSLRAPIAAAGSSWMELYLNSRAAKLARTPPFSSTCTKRWIPHQRCGDISRHPKASTGQSLDSHLSSALAVLSTPFTSLSSRLFPILKRWGLSESTVSEVEDSVSVSEVSGVQLVSLDGFTNRCSKTKKS